MKCARCNSDLAPPKTRFCGRVCNNAYNNAIREENNRLRVQQEKLSRGLKCAWCGWQGSSRALQFHHRDPATKKFNLSTAGWHVARAFHSEAEKCDMVCANCHAAHHHTYQEELYVSEVPDWHPV